MIATYPVSSDPVVESPAVCKRHVNDVIHASFGSPPGQIGFICECTRGDCFRVVWLSADEFLDARTEPRWTVLAASHDDASRSGLAQQREPEAAVR